MIKGTGCPASLSIRLLAK